jgi:hypothetical protein
MIESNELNLYNAEQYEEESFAPIIEESQNLNQTITTLYKASVDIDSDIAEVANKGNFDLLLIGVGKSIYEGTLLGKILGFTTRIINPEKLLNQVTGKEGFFENSPFDNRTKIILNKSEINVGILIDKELVQLDNVLIPIFSIKDISIIEYGIKLIKNSNSQLTIFDVNEQLKSSSSFKEFVRSIEHFAPNHVRVVREKTMDKHFLQQFHLMLINAEHWKKLVETKSIWLSEIPSTLIISEKEI